MEKRGLYFLGFILITLPAMAVWKVDTDGDGCIDQADHDGVESRFGGTGVSDYDVDQNKYIDERDLNIIQSYLDRGVSSGQCNGFLCADEKCNGEDDDCDGIVDEDEDMCGENMNCRVGECVFIAGKCYDSDGNDTYTQGTSIGETADANINKDESCYQVDIYSKLKEIQQCYGDDCYLIEYTCNGDILVQEQLQCDYGCRFGKCRKIAHDCNENDNGLDIFVNGMGSFRQDNGTLNLTDRCEDMNNDGTDETLIEYECLEEYDTGTNTLKEDYAMYEMTCACEDGVCTQVAKRDCIDTDGNEKYIRGYATGKDAYSVEVSAFDFCVEKIGKDFAMVDRCSGAACHVTEYACDPHDQIVKYVHECPLGCINGLCIGTECSKGEYFVLNEGFALSYDSKCELDQEEPDDPFDIPSQTFNNLHDYSCCSGTSETYCVYNGTCYQSSKSTNFYEFEGEVVVCGCSDASCSYEDGNHVGVWYDMDSSQDICEGGTSICNMRWYPETGNRWIKAGEIAGQVETVWEFEDIAEECCGDDSGEYVICEDDKCVCCDSSGDTYDNGKCSGKAVVPEPPPRVEEKPVEPNEPIDVLEPVPEPPVTDQRFDSNWYVVVPVLLAMIGIAVILLLGRKHYAPPDDE